MNVWRIKWQNKKFDNLDYLRDIIREIKLKRRDWPGNVAYMVIWNNRKNIGPNSLRKGTLRGATYRYKDNIELHLRQLVCNVMEYTKFAHGVSIGDLLQKRYDPSGFIQVAKFFHEIENY
jgi:hypothetical protein